jgi:hypothetical protein
MSSALPDSTPLCPRADMVFLLLGALPMAYATLRLVLSREPGEAA